MTTSAAARRKLYLMQLSATTVPLPGGRTLEMVSGCYLVETGDARHILMDSGMPADAPAPATAREPVR